ncbi:hypothetical protein GA0116948_102270 [Chitinophaga costaii]|uniref:Uncharacterized protein n=1 Tax=Chitinophaga costaii TaxID=1335309 RepID=A0A1C4ASZ2_9BACT|nr:hypothetical protein [Chitinophaga costaii]PUZ26730.1 hypothetical protein DCM91_10030 [Chitinophaga costaii]SCB97674.1 hypothetical protein GA0116948_102270 [Chitinophaga costaii]
MAARIRNYLAKQPGQKNTYMSPASVKSLFDKFLKVLKYAAENDKLIDTDTVAEIMRKVFVKVPDREEGLHWDVIDIRNLKKLTVASLMESNQRSAVIYVAN